MEKGRRNETRKKEKGGEGRKDKWRRGKSSTRTEEGKQWRTRRKNVFLARGVLRKEKQQRGEHGDLPDERRNGGGYLCKQ